jgi:hypothetical protein
MHLQPSPSALTNPTPHLSSAHHCLTTFAFCLPRRRHKHPQGSINNSGPGQGAQHLPLRYQAERRRWTQGIRTTGLIKAARTQIHRKSRQADRQTHTFSIGFFQPKYMLQLLLLLLLLFRRSRKMKRKRKGERKMNGRKGEEGREVGEGKRERGRGRGKERGRERGREGEREGERERGRQAMNNPQQNVMSVFHTLTLREEAHRVLTARWSRRGCLAVVPLPRLLSRS